MKTLKQLRNIQEAGAGDYVVDDDDDEEALDYQPRSDGEIEFVDLHSVEVSNHPIAPEDQHVGKTSHNKHKGAEKSGESVVKQGTSGDVKFAKFREKITKTPLRKGDKSQGDMKSVSVKEEVDLDEAAKEYEVKIKVGSKTNSYTILAKDELSAAQSVIHSIIARSKTGGSPGLDVIRKQYPDMGSLKKKGVSVSIKEEVDLDEGKSGTGYDLYHKDFSSAMKHAYDFAKRKYGITISNDEIDDKVATGPRKPSEGKTNSYRLKGDKGAIQVQVYNKGGSKPFELNMYKEDVELDEAKKVTKKQLRDLEDRNEHGLVALKLAQSFGTPAEVKKIQDINKRHNMKGHIEYKDQKERDAIASKYFKMAEEVEFIEEAVKAGTIKLENGKSIKVTKEDAAAFNAVLKELNPDNRKRMESEMMKDEKAYKNMLTFAKRTM